MFTITETADMLKVHPNTVRNWLHKGVLRCIRRGQTFVRITQSQIDEFVARNSTGLLPKKARGK